MKMKTNKKQIWEKHRKHVYRFIINGKNEKKKTDEAKRKKRLKYNFKLKKKGKWRKKS